MEAQVEKLSIGSDGAPITSSAVGSQVTMVQYPLSRTGSAAPVAGIDVGQIDFGTSTKDTSTVAGAVEEDGWIQIELVEAVSARCLVDDLVKLCQFMGTKYSLILEKLGGGDCQGFEVLTFQTHDGCVGLVLGGVVGGGRRKKREDKRKGKMRRMLFSLFLLSDLRSQLSF